MRHFLLRLFFYGFSEPGTEALNKTWSPQTSVSTAAPKSNGGTGPGTCSDDPDLSICVLSDLGLLGCDFLDFQIESNDSLNDLKDFFWHLLNVPFFFLAVWIH